MRRVRKQDMFGWMQKYPLLGRLFAFLVLLAFPFLVVPRALWEMRDDIMEAWAETVAAVFLPWEDRQ